MNEQTDEARLAEIRERWKRTVVLSPLFRDCGWLLEKLTERDDEIKRLQRIVDKRAKTEDGVPAVPGMIVWFSNGSGTIRKVCDGGKYGYAVEVDDADGPRVRVPLSDCYSTREAAEAAGDEP